MKNLKTFEAFQDLKEDDEPIELVGFPEGNIINVTKEEFDVLKAEEFTILWDDEIDYEEGNDGQWRFDNSEEDEIEEWLKLYRELKDPELVNNTLKYNV